MTFIEAAELADVLAKLPNLTDADAADITDWIRAAEQAGAQFPSAANAVSAAVTALALEEIHGAIAATNGAGAAS